MEDDAAPQFHVLLEEFLNLDSVSTSDWKKIKLDARMGDVYRNIALIETVLETSDDGWISTACMILLNNIPEFAARKPRDKDES